MAIAELTRKRARSAAWRVGLVLAMGVGTTLHGCAMAGWVAQGVTSEPRRINVEAEYLGLKGQSVAVLVDADYSTLFEHPLAQLEIAEVVSDRIAAEIPEVTIIDARQVVDFQERNVHWSTEPYGRLADRLGVDRIVLIELADYRLHEAGNVNLWRGTIRAHVGVVEADGPSPNDLAYATMVEVQYPPDRPLGVVNAQERTIRLATTDRFARAVVGKFHDHVREEPR